MKARLDPELEKMMSDMTPEEQLEAIRVMALWVRQARRPTQDGVLQFLSWMGRQKLFESN
jgi:hypothetical protein